MIRLDSRGSIANYDFANEEEVPKICETAMKRRWTAFGGNTINCFEKLMEAAGDVILLASDHEELMREGKEKKNAGKAAAR